MLRLRSTSILLLGLLAAVAGCEPDGSDNALGNLTVIVQTSGLVDADGYLLTVEGQTPRAMNDHDTTTFAGLEIGDYEVTLGDVEPGCSVAGGNPQTVYVPYGAKLLDLVVTCS